MHTGFVVRGVGPSDRAAVVSLIEGCEVLSREEKDCAVELLDIYLSGDEDEGYLFLMAETGGGEPVGYICYGDAALAKGVFEIYWIVVESTARRKGAGRLLLLGAEEDCRGRGARMLVTETSGLPSYEGARRFYTGMGFREEARVRDYYKPGDDKVIYVKNL